MSATLQSEATEPPTASTSNSGNVEVTMASLPVMPLSGQDLSKWVKFAETKGGIGQAVAQVDHLAESSQELMFMAGERIVILMQLEKSNETEEDLLLGYCEGVVGLLKRSQVKITTRLKKPVFTKRMRSSSNFNGSPDQSLTTSSTLSTPLNRSLNSSFVSLPSTPMTPTGLVHSEIPDSTYLSPELSVISPELPSTPQFSSVTPSKAPTPRQNQTDPEDESTPTLPSSNTFSTPASFTPPVRTTSSNTDSPLTTLNAKSPTNGSRLRSRSRTTSINATLPKSSNLTLQGSNSEPSTPSLPSFTSQIIDSNADSKANVEPKENPALNLTSSPSPQAYRSRTSSHRNVSTSNPSSPLPSTSKFTLSPPTVQSTSQERYGIQERTGRSRTSSAPANATTFPMRSSSFRSPDTSMKPNRIDTNENRSLERPPLNPLSPSHESSDSSVARHSNDEFSSSVDTNHSNTPMTSLGDRSHSSLNQVTTSADTAPQQTIPPNVQATSVSQPKESSQSVTREHKSTPSTSTVASIPAVYDPESLLESYCYSSPQSSPQRSNNSSSKFNSPVTPLSDETVNLKSSKNFQHSQLQSLSLSSSPSATEHSRMVVTNENGDDSPSPNADAFERLGLSMIDSTDTPGPLSPNQSSPNQSLTLTPARNQSREASPNGSGLGLASKLRAAAIIKSNSEPNSPLLQASFSNPPSGSTSPSIATPTTPKFSPTVSQFATVTTAESSPRTVTKAHFSPAVPQFLDESPLPRAVNVLKPSSASLSTSPPSSPTSYTTSSNGGHRNLGSPSPVELYPRDMSPSPSSSHIEIMPPRGKIGDLPTTSTIGDHGDHYISPEAKQIPFNTLQPLITTTILPRRSNSLNRKPSVSSFFNRSGKKDKEKASISPIDRSNSTTSLASSNSNSMDVKREKEIETSGGTVFEFITISPAASSTPSLPLYLQAQNESSDDLLSVERGNEAQKRHLRQSLIEAEDWNGASEVEDNDVVTRGSMDSISSLTLSPQFAKTSQQSIAAHRQKEAKFLGYLSSNKSPSQLGKKLKRLVRSGIPPSVRGRVWSWLMDINGIRREGMFHELCGRDRIPIYDQIERDFHQCLPKHSMFMSENSQARVDLMSILKAFAHLEPQIGFSVHLGYLSAILLLYAPAEEAFWLLIAIQRQLPTVTLSGLVATHFTCQQLLKSCEPVIYQRQNQENVRPHDWITWWFDSLYSQVLPLSTLLRVLDIFFLEGSKFLFRIALAISDLCRDAFIDPALDFKKLLKSPPTDSLDLHSLLSTAFLIKIRDSTLRKLMKKGEVLAASK